MCLCDSVLTDIVVLFVLLVLHNKFLFSLITAPVLSGFEIKKPLAKLKFGRSSPVYSVFVVSVEKVAVMLEQSR